MKKQRKKFENMTNYDNDVGGGGGGGVGGGGGGGNYNNEREKAKNYYNLLVAGKIIFNISVLIIFIIIL
jgi:hypothetical protein